MSLRIHVKMFTTRNARNIRICTEINGRSHKIKIFELVLSKNKLTLLKRLFLSIV